MVTYTVTMSYLDICTMNLEIQKAFHEAVSKNDVETARRKIMAGADVNAAYQVTTSSNFTYTKYSIFECLEDTRLEMLTLLIEAGANVNIHDDFGESPLSECVCDNEPETVKLLIANGANLNARDDEGSTPLFSAIICRQPEIVRLLIENGAEVNVVSTMPRESVLSMTRTRASYFEEEELHECVRILEEAGALENLILDIVDIPNLNKIDTAFLRAVQYQDIFGVKKALDAGANVNSLGRYEIPAIAQAAYFANKELTQLLVEAGTKSEYIEQACHECCYLESDAETFEYLLQLLDRDALNRVCNDLYKNCEPRILREIMDKQQACHFHSTSPTNIL